MAIFRSWLVKYNQIQSDFINKTMEFGSAFPDPKEGAKEGALLNPENLDWVGLLVQFENAWTM